MATSMKRSSAGLMFLALAALVTVAACSSDDGLGDLPPVPESPKRVQSRPETPKAETAKTETPKAETPIPEAPKAETPTEESPLVETPTPQEPRPESAMPVAPNPEPSLSYRHDLLPLEALNDYAEKTAAMPEIAGQVCVRVEHILIRIDDGMTEVQRGQAMERVALILRQAIENPRSFSNLRQANSEDPGEGVYSMVAAGTPARQGADFDRKTMVPAFGDVAWRLKVGEIGVAPPHPTESPYGYHIIMRLE